MPEYSMKQLKLDSDVCWIGLRYAERIRSAETPLPVETAYYALDFELSAKPDRADLLISAHSRYRLYVNGNFAAFGPCKSDEWHRYAERLDIAQWLNSGPNRIAIKVVSFPPRECESGGERGPQWSHGNAAGPCLLVDGNIGDTPLSTGVAAWRCLASGELKPLYDNTAPWLGYTEEVRGGKIPHLSAAIYDWSAPIRLYQANTDMYGIIPVFPLYERPIPLLYLKHCTFAEGYGDAVTVAPHSTETFLLDAGELATGFPSFNVSGGNGAKLIFTYAEAFYTKEGDKLVKRRRDDKNGVIQGHADVYYPSGGNDCYEPFLFRTFRYIQIDVETSAAPLTLQAPYYLETGYPLETVTTPLGGTEEQLARLWEISLRTLRRCMHETYEDCPYYEQLQYTMDTRLQILFTYALGGDTRLARKTIHEYHSSKLPNGMLQSRYPTSSPQVIPVFSLHWIFMLHDYYLQTADKDFLRGYLGTVDQILHYFRLHKQNGLAEFLGYWETVDWAAAWADNTAVPHACNCGPSTIQNFQYSYALQIAAELYELFGLCDMACSYRNEAGQINAALLKRCYNGRLFREGPDVEEYSRHAQLWAVLAGAGDNAFCKELLRNMLADDTLIPVSFPTVFYLLRAFEKAGLYELTAPLWEPWLELLDIGLTTIPEMSFGSPRSDCHAWGALLLYELPRVLLGVRPAEAGWTSIVVEPKGFYHGELSGRVWVPGGAVTVHRSVSGGNLRITVTPECDRTVALILPDGSRYKLENNTASVFECNINH